MSSLCTKFPSLGSSKIHNQGDVETKRESKEAGNMENEGNIPERKFSTGAISATVWRNNGKSKQGSNFEFRTVSLQRRYADKNGEWKTANSFRLNDLPKAALVLQKAYEYVVMKEPDLIAPVEELVI